MQIGNQFKAGKREPDAGEMQSRAAVVHMAQQLGAGQYGAQECPECGGGASKERCMSMLVEPNGIIKFNCHRAACGFAGQAYTTPGLAPHREDAPLANVSRINPLNADLYQLSEKEVAFFKSRYHLVDTSTVRRSANRYALPINAPDGTTRGWITRRAYADSPAYTESTPNETKALTFMEKDEPVLSWHETKQYDPREDYEKGVYLVEDQLSAMRLVEFFAKTAYTHAKVVALLGTGLNAQKVAEIQRTAGGSRVHFCLDADATGHAFAMARKWGQAFNECRVIVLDKDIKDSTDEELSKLPL
jgi:hypothetical protein